MVIETAGLDKSQRSLFWDYLNEDARALFDKPNTYFIGAFTGAGRTQTLSGVLAFSLEALSGRLLSVAVTPGSVRNGIGSELIGHFTDILLERGIPMADVYVNSKRHEVSAVEMFLWRNGFSPVGLFPDYEISLGELIKLPSFKKAGAKGTMFPNIEFYEEISEADKKKVIAKVYSAGYKGDFSESRINEQISTVSIKDGQVAGCLLFGDEEDTLPILYAYVDPGERKSGLIYKMLVQSLKDGADSFGKNKLVRMVDFRQSQSDIFGMLLDGRSSDGYVSWMRLELKPDMEADPEAPEPLSDDKLTGNRFVDTMMTPVTINSMVCRDCIYRLGLNDITECHKFSAKPDEVYTRGICRCRKKQL